MHDENTFITLTYNKDHLPKNQSLDHSDFQKFIRSLRQKTGKKISYYMCGEYGENFGRPHFHALIFGYKFPDEKLWTIRQKNPVHRSALLEKLWQKGFSETGTVTFQSAAYVARYIIKKQSKDVARSQLAIVDPDTGEMYERRQEYTKMSLKPAIGLSFYIKNKTDIFPLDKIILSEGKEYSVPKYYRELLKLENPDLAKALAKIRYQKATKKPKPEDIPANQEYTYRSPSKKLKASALASSEKIQLQQLALLKRTLQ